MKIVLEEIRIWPLYTTTFNLKLNTQDLSNVKIFSFNQRGLTKGWHKPFRAYYYKQYSFIGV